MPAPTSPHFTTEDSHTSVSWPQSQQSFSLLPNPWQSSPSSTGFLLGPLQEEQGQLSGSPCWTPNDVNSPFVLAGRTGGWGLHLCPSAYPCWSTHAAPSASPQQGLGQSPCSKQVDYSYFEDCLYCKTLLSEPLESCWLPGRGRCLRGPAFPLPLRHRQRCAVCPHLPCVSVCDLLKGWELQTEIRM